MKIAITTTLQMVFHAMNELWKKQNIDDYYEDPTYFLLCNEWTLKKKNTDGCCEDPTDCLLCEIPNQKSLISNQIYNQTSLVAVMQI